MNNKKNERGIAIVFALGFISLLFIIALGFVTTAIIEKNTEENLSSLTTARIMAESGLQRVLAGMKFNSSDPTKDYSDIYSSCISYSTSSPQATEDLEELLPTTVGSDVIYSAEDYSSSANPPTWQYLPSNHNAMNPIMARFAYIALDSLDSPVTYSVFGNKIDMSASIDRGLNANNNLTDAISEDYTVNEATSINTSGNPVIGRPGRDVTELFLATMPLIEHETDTAKYISADNANPAGLLPYGTRWISMNELCNTFAKPLEEGGVGIIINNTTEDSFNKVFAFDYLPIPEVFWTNNTNTYDVRSGEGLFHRFNLTRTDWNTLSVEDITDTENSLISFNASDSGNIEKCIPWLANWKSSGDMGNATLCKSQIIANLIDYNDSDNNATTDDADNPTYVGLEKVPYINELKLEIEAEVVESTTELFVNKNLNIRGNKNSFSGGHVNGNIQFKNKWYTKNNTNNSTINYAGTLSNQGDGNPDFKTKKVTTILTQETMPVEPSPPEVPTPVIIPTPPTIPDLTDITISQFKTIEGEVPELKKGKYEIKPGVYYFRRTITLTESGNDIKVKSGKKLNIVIPNNSIIYVVGKNKNIQINSANFDRTVTLISEQGNVNISGTNTDLTPASEAQNLQIYAGSKINISGSYSSSSGNLRAINYIKINGSNCEYTGYLNSDSAINIAGGESKGRNTIGTIQSGTTTTINSPNNTINGSIKSEGNITIEGGGNNTINGSIESNGRFLIESNAPKNIINGSINCVGNISIEGKENTIQGSLQSKSAVLLSGWENRGENSVGPIQSGTIMTIDSPNNTINGSIKSEGNITIEGGGNNTIKGSIEGNGRFLIESNAPNNTINGSINCVSEINIEGKENTITGSLQSSGSYVLISGWKTRGGNSIGSIKSNGYTTINSPNNIILGTIWSNNTIKIDDDAKGNNIGSTRSTLDTTFKSSTLNISKIAWSKAAIKTDWGEKTYSIPILSAKTVIYIFETTINNCSFLWSGANIKFNSACNISNASISCGGDLLVIDKNTDFSNNNTETLYTATVSIKDLALELVNMYDEARTCEASITIEGVYNWILDDTGSEVTFSKTFTLPNISATGDAYTISTYNGVDLDISPATTRTGDPGKDNSIENFKFTDLKVKLNYGYNLYDFAFIADDNVGNNNDDYTITDDGTQQSYFLDYEIADPRQNLNVSDWGGVTAHGNTDLGTIGTVNSRFTPNPGGATDPEPNATEPWEISTAYIRNAPMLSPWELGFIHRGKAWQTINLKKYNSTEDVSGGGNAYSDGDANILDQIKMTSDTETYGKINVNSNLEDVPKVLFEKINVGSDIASSDGPGALSGTEINDSIAGALAVKMLANNGTNGGIPFYTRAQIVRSSNSIPELCDNSLGLTQETDATQEEIIGKFINLSTALRQLPDQFTIIIVAQTINDIGAKGSETIVNINGVDSKTGRYDIGGDEIISTQKLLATVRRDPRTDKFYIVEYEYID